LESPSIGGQAAQWRRPCQRAGTRFNPSGSNQIKLNQTKSTPKKTKQMKIHVTGDNRSRRAGLIRFEPKQNRFPARFDPLSALTSICDETGFKNI
jgi:hypothetical protein